MSLLNLNPYAYIGGAVVALALAGTIFGLTHEMNHYKKLYHNDEVTVGVLNTRIGDMVKVQSTQTQKTAGNVTKVIQLPGKTQTIVKTIRDAPEPPNCGTPPLPEETTNAF